MSHILTSSPVSVSSQVLLGVVETSLETLRMSLGSQTLRDPAEAFTLLCERAFNRIDRDAMAGMELSDLIINLEKTLPAKKEPPALKTGGSPETISRLMT